MAPRYGHAFRNVLHIAILGAIGCALGCKDESPAKPSADLRGRPIIEAGKRPVTASTPANSTTLNPASDETPATTSQRAFSATVPSPGLYPLTTFDFLAKFKYQKPRFDADPTATRPDQFPPEIKALDGQHVTVIGYMAPLNLDEDGRVTEFMLLRNQLFCCYGKPLELNEWIEVTPADGKPIKEWKDIPLAASGTLSVGEKDLEGIVLNLYRMKLDELRPVDPKSKPKPLPPPK